MTPRARRRATSKRRRTGVVCPYCRTRFEFPGQRDAHVIRAHPDVDEERKP
jgi:hypothetical protein